MRGSSVVPEILSSKDTPPISTVENCQPLLRQHYIGGGTIIFEAGNDPESSENMIRLSEPCVFVWRQIFTELDGASQHGAGVDTWKIIMISGEEHPKC
jgi:hypothetical protein